MCYLICCCDCCCEIGIDAAFSEFPDRTRETLDVIANYTSNPANVKQAPCPIDCRMYGV